MTSKACEHLQPLVEFILASGNSISRMDRGWSEAELVVNFAEWVDIDQLKTRCQWPAHLEVWTNTDNHYELQEGVYCNLHKHDVAWPLKVDGKG